GFAIGNGYLDVDMLANSIVFFNYFHGLIGPQLWKNLTKYCCGGKASQETCNFVGNYSQDCTSEVDRMTTFIQNSNLNIYNLYAKCLGSHDRNSRYLFDKRNMLRYLQKPQKGLDVSYDPTCLDSSNIRKWINQPLVRKAIHIPSHVQNWDVCSRVVEDAYKQIYKTMKPQIQRLMNTGELRGLIYNGDIDMSCNFLGDAWFTDDLDLEVTKEYSPWGLNNEDFGYAKEYEYGDLIFTTIKKVIFVQFRTGRSKEPVTRNLPLLLFMFTVKVESWWGPESFWEAIEICICSMEILECGQRYRDGILNQL
ncbi:lysosomal protective protein, partial [Trichonephila inaurata madagascariensis]